MAIPEAVLSGFDRKEFYKMLQGHYPEKHLTCTNIARYISNLKKSGYVTVKKANCSQSICFTNKAQLAVIDSMVQRLKDDGKYCFVSFDIPEIFRVRRDKFRRVIKKMGFKQVQKSLWVNTRNVGQLVDLAANEFEVEQYVVYIISEKTNIDLLLPGIIDN